MVVRVEVVVEVVVAAVCGVVNMCGFGVDVGFVKSYQESRVGSDTQGGGQALRSTQNGCGGRFCVECHRHCGSLEAQAGAGAADLAASEANQSRWTSCINHCGNRRGRG